METMQPQRVGQMIADVRTRRGMSQEQLAKETGATRAWVSFVELGRIKRPDVDRLRLIATVLEVPAENLLAAAGYQATPRPTVRRPLSAVIRELYARLDELVEFERNRESDGEPGGWGRSLVGVPVL